MPKRAMTEKVMLLLGIFFCDNTAAYDTMNASESERTKFIHSREMPNTIEFEEKRIPMLKMKKILSLVIAGTMILGNMSVSAFNPKEQEIVCESEEEFRIHFQNDYAEVGEKLSVDAGNISGVTYQWFVGGIEKENQQSFYIPTEDDLEQWIEVRATHGSETVSTKLYCSKLPVVYIDTENGQEIASKETYIDAELKIQGNSKYKNDTVLYCGKTQIKGRGNSTWYQPKKPYRLKLEEKADIFGMGKSKHWVLLANYLDESFMRNTLSYDFSGALGMEHMSTVWVDVVLNGEYIGNYQLCENIRVDENRVDVYDWENFAENAAEIIASQEKLDQTEKKRLKNYMSEVMDWITKGTVQTYYGETYDLSKYPEIQIPEINGGYLLELDESYDEISKFRTNHGQPIMFKSPEYIKTNDEMLNYVKNYIQAFEDAAASADHTANYQGKDVHYSDLYDFRSLVDYWLVSEIFFNEEFNKRSTFMYQDHGGKMVMGPIWDMDHSSGSQISRMGMTADQWATLAFETNAQYAQWYKNLVKDPYFLMKVQERYWEIREKELQDMVTKIDGYYEYLKESGQADYEKWNRISFTSGTEELKKWLNTHITWMDSQMAQEDTLDHAFMSKSEDLSLSLTDTAGNSLAKDQSEYAPADALTDRTTDLLLHIKNESIDFGTAQIYINSKPAGTVVLNQPEAVYKISVSDLTEEAESKNVIEVKVKSDDPKNCLTNYITVKQKICTAHNFVWIIDKEAGEFSSGIQHEECSVCHMKRKEGTFLDTETGVLRIFGSTRYETSYAVADFLKEQKGGKKFETVIVATGKNGKEADALSGSYLAFVKNAPILLTNEKEKQIAQLHEYIRKNVVQGGEVYILGGENALPQSVETIQKEGYLVKRLFGNTRYETSVKILEEAGIQGNEIIVATGKTFADSLSASAVERPILLVKPGEALNEEQKSILRNINGGKIYIAGGINAVTAETEAELRCYGNVKRLKGKNRYETSVQIAEEFFENSSKAVAVNGKTAADGLCGGPFAMYFQIPLLLTKTEEIDFAADYLESKQISSGYVLGGENAISNKTVKELFRLEKD